MIVLNLRFVVPLAGTWIETGVGEGELSQIIVVPLAGTWIETADLDQHISQNAVVPLAGTWIETADVYETIKVNTSFPSRERGLKQVLFDSVDSVCCRSPRGNVD